MLRRWNPIVLLTLSISFIVAGCSSTEVKPTNPTEATQKKSNEKENIVSTTNENKNAPDKEISGRILVTVNGTSLTHEQAQALIQHGLARDIASVAQRWIEIQLKKEEAMKRKIDKIGQNAFIVRTFANHYLGFRILHDEIRNSLPSASEEDARKKYEQQIKNYLRPATFDIQHITMADKTKAEKIADEARKPDADFNNLVRQNSQAKDKNRLGRLLRMTQERIQRQFGKDVANAINDAKPDDVLGPLPGLKDFEIIKVTAAKPAETIALEKVKERIVQQINRENQEQAIKTLVEDLKANAKIDKSDELMELEKKAAEAARPAPGQPNAPKPPTRTAKPQKTPARPIRPPMPEPKPAAPKKEP